VLLVHFGNQHKGAEIHRAMPEMIEHNVIAGMLLGQIGNPEDLIAFISQQGH
jgi:hypothetical protein